MNMDFAARMRAAMKLTQEQKLIEATRVIQSALSGVNQPGSLADQALGRSKDVSSISLRRSLSRTT